MQAWPSFFLLDVLVSLLLLKNTTLLLPWLISRLAVVKHAFLLSNRHNR